MPPDVHENYDPPVDRRMVTPEMARDAVIDLGGRVDPTPGRPQVPLEMPGGNDPVPVPQAEPPVSTVVAFSVRHPSSRRVYDYAAIRAGNGLWYATGGTTAQGTTWEVLVRAVRERVVGPLRVLGPVREVYL